MTHLPGLSPQATGTDEIESAITLTQPWGGLIVTGVKRIENRNWKLPPRLEGRRVAIHASREVSPEVVAHLRDTLAIPVQPIWNVTGALIGVVRVLGCVSSLAELERMVHAGVVGPDQLRFWMGPFAFLLSEARVLETPVPCKGALGFWGLSESLRHQMVLREPA